MPASGRVRAYASVSLGIYSASVSASRHCVGVEGDHGEYIARFDSELKARWQAPNNFHEDASALPFLPTADEWAEHVNYVIKLVGADHVAIGLDMVPGRTGVLADATGYPDLIAALGRITTADNIRKISGENYMRVFSQVQAP